VVSGLRKRGLLLGTTKDILDRAKAHPQRLIVIGTEEDTKRPMLPSLKHGQTYNQVAKRQRTSPPW
jgi:hypothetical protein